MVHAPRIGLEPGRPEQPRHVAAGLLDIPGRKPRKIAQQVGANRHRRNAIEFETCRRPKPRLFRSRSKEPTQSIVNRTVIKRCHSAQKLPIGKRSVEGIMPSTAGITYHSTGEVVSFSGSPLVVISGSRFARPE